MAPARGQKQKAKNESFIHPLEKLSLRDGIIMETQEKEKTVKIIMIRKYSGKAVPNKKLSVAYLKYVVMYRDILNIVLRNENHSKSAWSRFRKKV